MCIQGKARKIFFRCIHHFNRVKTLRNFSVFLLKVLKLFHLLDLFKHLLSHSLLQKYHCAKNVQIWSFFWPIFCHIWPEYRKNGPEKTLHLETFYAVYVLHLYSLFLRLITNNFSGLKMFGLIKLNASFLMTKIYGIERIIQVFYIPDDIINYCCRILPITIKSES